MIRTAKLIGTGLATIGLIGAGVGVGIIFRALNPGITWSQYLKSELISYAIYDFFLCGVNCYFCINDSFFNTLCILGKMLSVCIFFWIITIFLISILRVILCVVSLLARNILDIPIYGPFIIVNIECRAVYARRRELQTVELFLWDNSKFEKNKYAFSKYKEKAYWPFSKYKKKAYWPFRTRIYRRLTFPIS